jgi:hypothetical protein
VFAGGRFAINLFDAVVVRATNLSNSETIALDVTAIEGGGSRVSIRLAAIENGVGAASGSVAVARICRGPGAGHRHGSRRCPRPPFRTRLRRR